MRWKWPGISAMIQAAASPAPTEPDKRRVSSHTGQGSSPASTTGAQASTACVSCSDGAPPPSASAAAAVSMSNSGATPAGWPLGQPEKGSSSRRCGKWRVK